MKCAFVQIIYICIYNINQRKSSTAEVVVGSSPKVHGGQYCDIIIYLFIPQSINQ